MQREVKGILYNVFNSQEMSRYFSSTRNREDVGGLDGILKDTVILKSYDDHIVLDVGGHKEMLRTEDFISIEIV